MQLEKSIIEEANHKQQAAHQRRFDFVATDIKGLDTILKKLSDFQVAIPSWALGTGGTRFGRFSGGGEPRSLEEKVEDVGLIHALNKSSNSISLHIPWDIPDNAAAIKTLAAQHGLHFDAVNSNTFQDQPSQQHSYKYGSLHHVDKAVRKQAVEHNIEVINYGVELDSKALSLWLSDGSNFPGQLNMRGAFERTLESLQEIYEALPADWKIWIEYKPYEPNFYSTTIGDWGQSYLLSSKLGNKAQTLVDLGHHLQGANIEQIVSLLLMEGKLAGFHFNDSKYGDDDLTVGSINPYQLFLIFNELVEGMDARGLNHATGIGWMIDASHNIKDPVEDLLQSVEAIKIAYTQALLVDQQALKHAQQQNDVVLAQEILQHAYRTDVRPLVAEARSKAGGALQPLDVYRQQAIRQQLISERGHWQYQPVYNMDRIPVIAVFDVGKTNKKLFLFDENYKIVFEKTARFTETHDEDGDTCENLDSLRLSVFDSLREIFKHQEFDLKAVNFSTYGASFVYVDEDGRPLTPLYNYLKPYPPELGKQFYENYGDEAAFARETASPVLGNLNSGLQLYRLKYQQPEVFEKIKYALHLPQYMSYLLSGQMLSDLTSIGCHTALWDFGKNNYHEWLAKEEILPKMAPLKPADEVLPAIFPGSTYSVGIGLHDSSAALIPYLVSFHMPFVLISTGTWSISLNPFNQTPLTEDELKHDCLNYLQYKGSPVKASRLFTGYEYEQEVKRIAAHFNQDAIRYRNMAFEPTIVAKLQAQASLQNNLKEGELQRSVFEQRDLHDFKTDTEAYHQLMIDIVQQQIISTNYVLQGCRVQRIFVDGGFSKNTVFMHLLAFAFPHLEVYAASMAQATAVGTALAIHQAWNTKPLPHDLIELKYYSGVQSEAHPL